MNLFNKIIPDISQKIFSNKGYKCLNSFNKSGNRVYLKRSISNKLLLKKINAPKNTLKADIVEIEKDFGKQKVRIISFKDKENKLLSRLTENGDFKTVSKYKLDDDIYDVSRKTFKNNKLQGTLHSITKIISGDKSIHYNSVLKTQEIGNGARREVQKITQNVGFMPKCNKELTTEGIRFADGSTKLENITGINIKDIESFKNDPYIMIRNYTNNDFVESLFQMLSKRFNIKNKPKLKISVSSECSGVYNNLTNSLFIYNIDNCTKNDLVDTVAHELRHAKQHESNIFNILLKMFSPDKQSKSELKLDKHFIKSDILYPGLHNIPMFNKMNSVKKAYLNNGLEIDARKWGKRISDEYQRYAESENFNKDLLGCNSQSLFSIFSKLWKKSNKTVSAGIYN